MKYVISIVLKICSLQCDVENTDVDNHKLSDFCKSHNLIGWFATSAKDNLCIGKYHKFR